MKLEEPEVAVAPTVTTVTLTGTGHPIPVPGRAGPGVMVRRGPVVLQFDAGRATALRLIEAGVRSCEVSAVFLTHHHSDHVSGLPDMVFSRWIQTPMEVLTIVGPSGPLERFVGTFLDPWAEDLEVRRTQSGRTNQPQPKWQPFTATATEQTVWEHDGVSVSSVLVRHEPVTPAVGYKVQTPEGSVVVSGDTRVCDEIEELAQAADVLVHEVVLSARVDDYVRDYHADAIQLGALAQRAAVGTLMLTHLQPPPKTQADEQAFVDEVRSGGYTGEVIVGRDLESVAIGNRRLPPQPPRDSHADPDEP